MLATSPGHFEHRKSFTNILEMVYPNTEISIIAYSHWEMHDRLLLRNKHTHPPFRVVSKSGPSGGGLQQKVLQLLSDISVDLLVQARECIQSRLLECGDVEVDRCEDVVVLG